MSAGDHIKPLQKPLPARMDRLDQLEMAWLGDAQLAADVRFTILFNGHHVDSELYQELTCNSFQAKYLLTTEYADAVEGSFLNEHSLGTLFEFLYYTDHPFRDKFRETVGLKPFEENFRLKNLGRVPVVEQSGRCWTLLFSGVPTKGNHPCIGEGWLTRGQLLAIKEDNPLSGKSYSLSKISSSQYHVELGGDMSAIDVINALPKKARLGGVKPLREVCPNVRKNFPPLSPFQGLSKRDFKTVKRPKSLLFGEGVKVVPRLQSKVSINPKTEGCESESLVSKFLALGIELERSFLPESPDPVAPLAGMAPSSREMFCWSELFPGSPGETMTIVQFRDLVVGRFKELKDSDNQLAWRFFFMEVDGPVWHVHSPSWKQKEGMTSLVGAANTITKFIKANGVESRQTLVGLTTAVVMGTIGDVEPTLDVVATNFFAAEMTRKEVEPSFEDKYSFEEAEGSGWTATDFFTYNDDLAKALSEKYGAKKGNLKVSPPVWNDICSLWGGTPFELPLGDTSLPGTFPGGASHPLGLLDVPVRTPGPHVRVMPEDFVLVTHPDHIQRFALEKWETVSLPIDSKAFIKLGQDILEKGIRALQDMKAMHRILFECLAAGQYTMEQSDLIYLVSGTTFHYFLASLFPEKQVFEICPVPREDNGTCPEFYLGHYFKDFSIDPHFGFKVGRLYNKWLTAPKYLKELEWEGEYKYVEPPKFHSISPWAARKWQISGPNVGFKPYDDFVRKTNFNERPRIKAYFSLGSCESLTPETEDALVWLKSLNVDWFVDSRWCGVFGNTPHQEAPFFSHALGLSDYDWVVHHGGSGVTNTCLCVGVPQTILPQIGDQFIWQDALKDHVIPPFTREGELRAYLYHKYLVRPFVDEPPQECFEETWWREAIEWNKGRYVRPYWVFNHCCHDWDAYGWKPCELVVAETDAYYFTIFISNWENKEKPQKGVLKFIRKVCSPVGPPVGGRSGWVCTMTYPNHAHGWLFNKQKFSVARKVVSGYDIHNTDENQMRKLAKLALTSRDKRNPYYKCPPDVIHGCPTCGKNGYDFGGRCEWCVVSVQKGFFPDSFVEPIISKIYASKALKKKGVRMMEPYEMAPVGFAVRSRSRYFQIDSRSLDKAQNYRVARALLDDINGFEDVLECEAFWNYTNTQPPHYQFTWSEHAIRSRIESKARMHVSVEMSGIGEEIVQALGSILSVSSVKSLSRRVIGLNVLSRKGRSFMFKRWHVLVDALRHYDDFTRSLGIKAMPQLVKEYFPQLPLAEVKSLIPWNLATAKQIKTRVGTKLWFDKTDAADAPIKIHLFSLKLPSLGTRFGVFHSVIEHNGRFWELQQISGERCHINQTKWRPESTPDRPLVKTILVNEKIVHNFDGRVLNREFDGLDYKVIGDNCLVFANLIVFLLTGKVVPWKHFGAFGADITLEVWPNLSKWASSWVFLDDDEERVRVGDTRSSVLNFLENGEATSLKSWIGPKQFHKDYGLDAVRRVDAAIHHFEPEGGDDCPKERDYMLDLMFCASSKFGVTGQTVARAIMTRRLRRIPTSRRKFKILEALLVNFRQFRDIKIVQDFTEVIKQAPSLRGALRKGKKMGWTPLVSIAVPRHWFRSGNVLVEVQHQKENLLVQPKKRIVLDLPQIAKKYKDYFPDVDFPPVGFKYIKPGEYEVGVKVPLRRGLPKMDQLTENLIRDLQEIHPFEVGVFSLRFGTTEMAEKITDRYFAGSFEPGQLISETEQDEIAEAIFNNEQHLYKDAQLINPEEVWKKWHRNYSAGFPYRFNSKGNSSRQAFVDAAGGKAKFLEGIRRYIESPEAFPTVSHSFIKDEVLPKSYIEREKIRTIIAQDPLNYFLAMACQADHSKRLDPTSFSAVGVSAAHGEMAALAEQHLAYRHHYAMDVTSLDSTAAVDAVAVIKKLRKKGFQNHKQKNAIETMIDATYDNLVTSWIVDIHTGRSRLKKQGLTTGHASTTSSNTEYMRVLILKAWKGITGRPYQEFYETVKFSSFSDDNFWSSDLPKETFSAELISKYWLERGVQVRVEGASDDLAQISFLSKRFSLEEEHLKEVEQYTGMHPRVAVVHDLDRLLQKFSDYKKKNTLRYRYEKFAALQLNCAHHKVVYDKVDEYLDALEKELAKRPSNKKFLKQHPRTSYDKVMRLMYVPTEKTKANLIVSTMEQTFDQKLANWWDTLRADIMTFDSTANTYGRILSQFVGLLEIGGLNVEEAGTFLKGPGELRHDDEFTLEHHLYLLNGCPENIEKMQICAQKSPFSQFMDIEGFWARREWYDLSEEMANGLRVKVMMLLAIYTMVAWLEQALMTVPIIGPMYRLFATAKYMSEKAYSRLNSLYYATFGDSSIIISSLMPKDRYFSLKVIAHNMWCSLTSTDLVNFSGDIGNLKGLVDAMVKLGQDIHNLTFEFDHSVLLPQPNTGERDKSFTKEKWIGLDHSASAQECIGLMQENKIPLVTAETGAGKSTDFVLSLKEKFTTVIVACPRTILVENSPVATTRLYAGCTDSLTPGAVNFGTAGYLRRVLGDLPADTVLALDEFHELNEDSLWLLERYRGSVLTISATPNFCGADALDNVHLTKSRAAGHIVEEVVRSGTGTREEAWNELLKYVETDKKVLVILPTIAMVETFEQHCSKLVSSKRVCSLYRGNTQVDEADWYFATSVVDAGLTIPDLAVVIDTGWSLGYQDGKFSKRPSSHNISEQRRGRTGRTCDGRYIRLMDKFVDTPWDMSTSFLCNNWHIAEKWSPTFVRGICKEIGVLESLPGGYKELMDNANWSAMIYLTFLYENRLDVNRARELYQSCRKFPERKDFRHLMAGIENQPLSDLHVVEGVLRKFRLPNQHGNVWNWNLSNSVLMRFDERVPARLRDLDRV